MNPALVMQGVSMVAGWFGSMKAKSRERKKISRLKGYARTAQRDYGHAAGNIHEKYTAIGSMMKEGYGQQNLLDAWSRKDTEDSYNNQISMTGMANIAGREKNQMMQGFDMQQNQRSLERKGAAFELQEQAAGEYRDVKKGLLGLQRDAAESGFTLKKGTFNLQNYIDRRYIS